jgi:SagB-type dehydrogenase family enzyme
MEAFGQRHSSRDFLPDPIGEQLLSDLLWAANGVNRTDGKRTAPSALNAQEIDIILVLPSGAYRYVPQGHSLKLVAASDVRTVTGYQDFVDTAPLDLVFVANHRRLALVPVDQRRIYAAVAVGAISQNVYLFAASAGLATVIRAWINRAALAEALGLSPDEEVLLAQTVGLPAR